MIQERFLISAVNIRRRYLKVSNTLNLYNKQVKMTVDTLNDTLKKLDELKLQIEKSNSDQISEKEAFSSLLKILKNVEDEGNNIEKLAEPINQEIEKLALEEQELYQEIKKNHLELTDDQIVESVRKRLLSEGLS